MVEDGNKLHADGLADAEIFERDTRAIRNLPSTKPTRIYVR
jgi:hypothetical protein